jgi:aminoglycoside 3-N-acetyltransferase
VHASLKAIGSVVGGAAAVIAALVEAVGELGLVGMPAFSNDAYLPEFLLPHAMTPEAIRLAEVSILDFDPATSPTAEMGAIAELFRSWPGTSRSAHPCVSICLHGRDAHHYLDPHSLAWATGPDTPLGRLIGRPHMKVLLIGVGWNRCSALHTAETYATHRRLKTRRFKASPVVSTMVETPDVANDLGRLFP